MSGNTYGDMAFVTIGGKRVAKLVDIEIRDTYNLQASEPLGKALPDEIILTGMGPCEVNMTIEQVSTQDLTDLGITPKHGTTLDILTHPEASIVIESVLDSTILDRITGFRPANVGKSYRKGELTVFDVSGQGQRHTHRSENNP